MKNAIVIGSGFAGLSAACFLAKAGMKVTLLEKNTTVGGRARQFSEKGFHFDMGPSWYWMPDVFERFFQHFGKKVEDLYKLQRLDPSYRIYWPDDITDVPADLQALKDLFEQWEPGSAHALDRFLKEAAYKYDTGMQKLVYKPGRSVKEFIDPAVIKGLFRLDIFTSITHHIDRYFKHPKIRQMLEFPVLFLGALPEKTPALYSLMNYADIIGGTWYPAGGMYTVVNAMRTLAEELNVEIRTDHTVRSVEIANDHIERVITDQQAFTADLVVNGADYHHMESAILPAAYRTYSPAYWNSRVMAPSCLLYFVGINKKLKNIRHHSLFFDTSFVVHGKEIYSTKEWPSDPLFYVSAPSVTDPKVAPEEHENLFFLVPIASGLTDDSELIREQYFNTIVKRFEARIGEQIRENIVVYRSFATSDFITEYNAFKGNAYGLANTLMQTAILKPSCRSKKIRNLFHTGQLTVPGPGVPPALISGEVVANEALKAIS